MESQQEKIPSVELKKALKIVYVILFVYLLSILAITWHFEKKSNQSKVNSMADHIKQDLSTLVKDKKDYSALDLIEALITQNKKLIRKTEALEKRLEALESKK